MVTDDISGRHRAPVGTWCPRSIRPRVTMACTSPCVRGIFGSGASARPESPGSERAGAREQDLLRGRVCENRQPYSGPIGSSALASTASWRSSTNRSWALSACVPRVPSQTQPLTRLKSGISTSIPHGNEAVQAQRCLSARWISPVKINTPGSFSGCLKRIALPADSMSFGFESDGACRTDPGFL